MTSTSAAPARADLRAAALGYAAAGIPVFPCAPGGKTPLTRTGFHAASTDPDLITAWWRRRPDANIATPTGAPGFDVLDVDVRADGTGWPAYTTAERGRAAARVATRRRHPLRRAASALPRHRATQRHPARPAPGLPRRRRVRAAAALHRPPRHRLTALPAARPPARSRPAAALGRHHRPAHPSATPPRQPPRRRDGVDPTSWLAGHVARQREGNRDNALFWAACRAAEAGITDLQPLIDAAITAGLPQPQAARTVASARTTIPAPEPGHGLPVPARPSNLRPPVDHRRPSHRRTPMTTAPATTSRPPRPRRPAPPRGCC